MCSPEHCKLCFEHLEMISDAQNNLPLRGTFNFSEVENSKPLRFPVITEKKFKLHLPYFN